MSDELTRIVQTSGLEQTKGQKLLALFTPYFNRLAEIEAKINLLNPTNPEREDIIIAKEIRLSLRNNRVASEKIKDDSKALILAEGRVIDNLNNIIKNTSKPLEEKCEQVEKFAEIQEQRRKEERKIERVKLLEPYASEYPYNTSAGYFSFNYNLLDMTDVAFDDLLASVKLNCEKQKQEKLKAEEERIAREKTDAEERERIRQENIKLKAEREEREKEIAIERAKAETERRATEEKSRLERAEQEAKLKKEREERERLEAELKAGREKEESDKRAKALAEKKARQAPDKEKLNKLAESIKSLSIPELATEEAVIILQRANRYLNAAIELLKTIND